MTKKPRGLTGRPKATDKLTDLKMARSHLQDQVPVRAVAELYDAAKSTASLKIEAVRTSHPEFAAFLAQLEPSAETATAVVYQTRLAEAARKTEEQATRLAAIQQDLAGQIEKQIGYLLDMTPEEIYSMKPDQRLKHVPELVKAMRLLQEKSTENVQKLSLVKAVSIATARRQSTTGS